jgi:tRNA threonylcarbamoyladenosine biosynthesis protein TsaB
MYVLGVDTSTDHAICFVADQNGHVYHAAVESHDRDLSARLYPLIDRLLTSAGLDLSAIEIYATGIGPGSFTGVRIAVSTMRTLAQVSGKQLVAVSTLAVLARTAAELIQARDRKICAVLPSRRGEAYAAVFRNGRLSSPAVAAPYAEALTGIESPILAGPQPLIDAILSESRSRIIPDLVAVKALSPAAFATLAAEEIAAGQFQNPLTLDPMYIAPPAVSQHKAQEARH